MQQHQNNENIRTMFSFFKKKDNKNKKDTKNTSKINQKWVNFIIKPKQKKCFSL